MVPRFRPRRSLNGTQWAPMMMFRALYTRFQAKLLRYLDQFIFRGVQDPVDHAVELFIAHNRVTGPPIGRGP
jgi:hypothetical protein